MKHLLLFLFPLISYFNCQAQSFEIKPRIGWMHQQSAGSSTIGDINLSTANKSDNSFVGVDFRYRYKKLLPEVGVTFHQHNYSYQLTGLSVKGGSTNLSIPAMKAGAIGGSELRIPILLNYQLYDFLRLRGGCTYAYNWYGKHEDIYFEDVSAYSEAFNSVGHSFKKSLFYLNVGAGLDWRNFGLDALLHLSLDSANKSFQVDEIAYSINTETMFLSIELSYRFEILNRNILPNK